MRPVTADLLARGAASLDKARRILAVGIPDVAAREAYMAAFHIAQAVLFERQGRAAKTHAGVRGTFRRLAKEDPQLGPESGRLLARLYDYKEAADYRLDVRVTAEEAAPAIDEAADLVRQVTAALGMPPAADRG
jgi:uncharacterized protein (UPF0332 family)